MEFLSALLAIVVIDLVLAGDNAIVIGLAARNLPKHQQKKAIFFGTFGAIILRIAATVGVVWLLKIPGLLVIGGLLLIWIAYKLLTEEKGEEDIKASTSLWAAVRTIIIADAAMGIDNVLAIAGAANGHILTVIIGLLISIPIVVWGSTLILKWMERFPVIITIGAGVLAWTASKMIASEPMFETFFANDFIKYGFEIFVIAAVIITANLKKRGSQKAITQ